MLEATSEFVLRVEAEVENVSETVVLDLSKHFVKYEFSLDLPDNKGGANNYEESNDFTCNII